MKVHSITFLCLFSISFIAQSDDALIELNTRNGITQKFLLNESAAVTANVILFVGGHGRLNLSAFDDNVFASWGKKNFLFRSRDAFVKNNFTVAVVDAPSDMQTSTGMLGGFRTSREHVQDIDYVISYLRELNNKSVWLIGTSRGTESAAYVAIHSQQSPNGVVLSSSMTENNAKGIPVTQLALNKITIPVLITSHIDDECWVTPPIGADEIKEKLTSSTTVQIETFTGGNSPKSDPCMALSPHGYFGIENEVISVIAKFINNNRKIF